MPWGSLLPLIPGDDRHRELVLERLRLFAIELLKWNQGVSNLVSRDDEPRLVERHVAESLGGAEIIKTLGCRMLVDFGTGGGFPALPLAIAGVGSRWTLVESRRNKTLFLRRAIQELKLEGVGVLTSRLETLIESDPALLACDGFTSRATSRLQPTLALAARIVRPGGHAILWKGSGLRAEHAAASAEIVRHWGEPAFHAIGDGPNSIVVFQRNTLE
jgi:16S rRNA (guanine527-N7)-methyltransferase